MNLERLAELINAKWASSLSYQADITEHGHLRIGEYDACSDPLMFEYRVGYPFRDDDIQNAQFIIWCLERLEELWRNHWAEQVSNLRHGIDLIGAVAGDEEYCVHVVVYPESDNWTPTAMYPPGKTRAEACALALMQALEGSRWLI